MNASVKLQTYFDNVEKEVLNQFEIATKARKKGIDPEKRSAQLLL